MSTAEEIVNIEQPTIIEVVLYRNNWKDNQLIHNLRRKTNMLEVSEKKDSFFVSLDEFKNCLGRFDKEIKELNSVTEEDLLESVNSLYFIQSVLSVFKNLKFVKVNVSNKRIYTRVVKESISFTFKVIYSTIVLSDYIKQNQKNLLIKTFKDLKFIEEDGMLKSTYVSIRFNELVDSIKSKYGHDKYGLEKQAEIFEILFDLIDEKTEIDNPIILFIF